MGNKIHTKLYYKWKINQLKIKDQQKFEECVTEKKPYRDAK